MSPGVIVATAKFVAEAFDDVCLDRYVAPDEAHLVG
jgi:hypothetical protein